MVQSNQLLSFFQSSLRESSLITQSSMDLPFILRCAMFVKKQYTIECRKLEVQAECFGEMMIVSMQGQWTNLHKDTLDCVFAVPLSGKMISVTLNIGNNRVLTTDIVSREDADFLIRGNPQKSQMQPEDRSNVTHIIPEGSNPYEEYVPDVFRLPFGNVNPGEGIAMTCEYIEPLSRYKKGYIVSLPLYFPRGTIVENRQWKKVVNGGVRINGITNKSKVLSFIFNLRC